MTPTPSKTRSLIDPAYQEVVPATLRRLLNTDADDRTARISLRQASTRTGFPATVIGSWLRGSRQPSVPVLLTFLSKLGTPGELVVADRPAPSTTPAPKRRARQASR